MFSVTPEPEKGQGTFVEGHRQNTKSLSENLAGQLHFSVIYESVFVNLHCHSEFCYHQSSAFGVLYNIFYT